MRALDTQKQTASPVELLTSLKPMDEPTPTPINGGFDDFPLIPVPDPTKGFSLINNSPAQPARTHTFRMFLLSLIYSLVFSIPFNVIYLSLAMIIGYPFAATLMAHREEKSNRNHRHLFPLDLTTATHYFVLEDPRNSEGDVYSVYTKDSRRALYNLSRLSVEWWQSPFVERWKLTDRTGFELAQIQYVFRGLKNGLIHFLLPRPEELGTGPVHRTAWSAYPTLSSPQPARFSSSPMTTDHITPSPRKLRDTIWCQDSNRDTVEYDDEVFLRNYNHHLNRLENIGSPGMESSLRDNALISLKQLGTPMNFDPLSLVEDGHLRDLHHVLVSVYSSLKECRFKLTRDNLCQMAWDTVGNLEKTYKSSTRDVCERVGLFSTVVSQERVGYRVVFNEDKIDPLSAVTTSFLQYKIQKV